jgi:tripartite-type tricarboxylate transporter receptor subunit TctC
VKLPRRNFLHLAAGAAALPAVSRSAFGELFKIMAGVDMVHVPYRSAGLALTDLLGGQAQIIFPTTVAPTAIGRSGGP